MTNQRYKRKIRNIIVDPEFQLKYTGWIFFTGIVVTLTNSLAFFYFTRQNYKVLVDLSPMDDAVKIQLYSELYNILILLVVFSIGFIVVVTIVGIIMSHRTAGPMYHFKRVFQEVQRGNFQARIRLRKRDYFRDVAEECNRMIEFLTKNSR